MRAERGTATGVLLVSLLGLLLCACAPRSARTSAPVSSQTPTVQTAPPELAPLLARVNAYRQRGADCGARGRYGRAAPLVWNVRLAASAQGHSRDMASSGAFAHQGSDGSDAAERAERQGYDWSAVGETLAYSTPGHFDAETVVDAWLGSPGHCATLLEPAFRELGAGRDLGALEYWTVVLGAPRSP